MKYIICGIENIGLRIIDYFALKNCDIVLILDKGSPETFQNRPGLFVITGNPCDDNVLLQAGITDADVIMVVTKEDIINLKICIKARILNKKIKVISRMFYTELNNDIEKYFDIDQILSVSSIAAPAFYSACINPAIVHTFPAGDHLMFLAKIQIPADSGSVKTMDFEKEFSVKVFSIKEADSHLIEPGMNDLVKPGCEVYYFTSGKNIIKKISSRFYPQTDSDPVKDSRTKNFSLKQKNIPANLIYLVASYFILILISSLIFKYGMGFSFIDALYFVITTTTTVGYGDINLQQAPPFFKVFGIFLMISGAFLIAALFSIVTENLVSKKIDFYMGVPRTRMKNHIIITGLGKLGYKTANLLKKDRIKIVGIEKDVNCRFTSYLRDKFPIIYGDAVLAETLIKANVQNAGCIMALTDNDLTNINIIFNARKINPGIKVVARIFENEIELKISQSLATDRILSGSIIALPTFIASAMNQDAVFAYFYNDEIYTVLRLKHTVYHHLKAQAAGKELKLIGIARIDASGALSSPCAALPDSHSDWFVICDYESITSLIRMSFDRKEI